MKAIKIKVEEFEVLDAEIDTFKNSGYFQCKHDHPRVCRKIVFYWYVDGSRRQKTVYLGK